LDYCCSVFYLEPLTIEQERAVRRAVQADIGDFPDVGCEYCFFGYLWPSGSEKHTVQDMRDLFEKCDPRSLSFDPSYSNVRMLTYPNEWVAVDARVSTMHDHLP